MTISRLYSPSIAQIGCLAILPSMTYKRLWDSFFHLFYFVDLTLLYHHYLQGEFFILCSHKELDFDVTQTYLLFLFI